VVVAQSGNDRQPIQGNRIGEEEVAVLAHRGRQEVPYHFSLRITAAARHPVEGRRERRVARIAWAALGRTHLGRDDPIAGRIDGQAVDRRPPP
jgi:hypothetical protein